MAKEIKMMVYTYQELVELHKQKKITDKAMEKVKDWLRGGQTNHDWWEYIYEWWVNALNQIGFENPKISFSGFGSQGDGACFTSDANIPKLAHFLSADIEGREGVDVDSDGETELFLPAVVNKLHGKCTKPGYRRIAWLTNLIRACVTRIDSRYSHEHTCRFEFELDDFHRGVTAHIPKVNALVNEFRRDCEELRVSLCQAIYRDLEEEYFYLTGDEALADTAEANGYTFTITGRREG